MKKVLFVGLFGGLLLLVGLWAAGRKGDAGAIAAPVVASAPGPATAVAPPAVPATTAATAPAAAPGPTGDTAACARLAELCSTSDRKVDTDECHKQLRDARRMSGAGNVDRSEVCLAEAKTCAAATGCISGGIGMGATGEFLKGFGSALSR